MTVSESSFAKEKVVEQKGLSDSLTILLIREHDGNSQRSKILIFASKERGKDGAPRAC